jgi:hypothetical protein
MRRWLFLFFLVILLSGCDQPVEELPDTTAPVLTLQGDEHVTMVVGGTYVDDGVLVEDEHQTTLLTSGIENLDVNQVGRYHIYYNAFDEAGNVAEEVVRTIDVVHRAPGVLASFTTASDEFVTISVMVIDPERVMTSLTLSLYDGTTPIDEVQVEGLEFSHSFTDLSPDKTYEVRIHGTYELGGALEEGIFTKPSLTVGTYRTITDLMDDEDIDPVVLGHLEGMVYLPFDRSMDSYTKPMIHRLAGIGEPMLARMAASGLSIVLIDLNDRVTDVPAYAHLASDLSWDPPGICCSPMVAKINYHGTSIDVLLQLTGTYIDELYAAELRADGADLYALSLTVYWQSISEAEARLMFPTSQYGGDPMSYFMEAFAHYYYGETSRSRLAEVVPMTHAFFHNLEDILDGVIVIDWDQPIPTE